MFSTGIYANASTKIITANGFVKTGSDDTSVLLAGGGAKALSDFAIASHTHSFTTDITDRPFYDSPYSDGEYYWSWNPLGLTLGANIHGWSFKDPNLGTDIGVIKWYLAREGTSNTCLNFNMDGNIQIYGKMYA